MQPEYDYLSPHTLTEALECLDSQEGVVPICGGTNLVVDMRGGRHSPHVVVDISRLVELKGIRQEEGRVRAGGAVTLSECMRNIHVQVTAPALVQATKVFANPLVRNRATLAGNLADGSPAADTAPPLLALGASVILASPAGMRSLPLDKLFLGVRRTALQPGELIVEVTWPVPSARNASAFYKVGLRKADAISVASAAVFLELDEANACTLARIAMGSVAPTPLRALEAERYLVGRKVNPETAAEAGQLAAQAASPISDVRASADYRRKVTAVITRRLLLQAAHQILEEVPA